MKLSSSVVLLAIVTATSSQAQTRSVRETATAYGARLDAKGEPAALNKRRVNSRIDSRIDNRLSLRIERYRPSSTSNPTAAYRAPTTDKTREAPIVTAPARDDTDQ